MAPFSGRLNYNNIPEAIEGFLGIIFVKKFGWGVLIFDKEKKRKW